ncbi:histidinol-phosphate aminotransferase, putative [Trichomonas vaginalis G3]|uniref:Histidinol-phosphate aminotransferase, putative n=1 Tax=Trichomonas vaginalis (strain ATCC PRA-98 / G3) TaxID=412133 RepID=A2DIT9_TRIV3|nr:aminotransferase-related family [Trichomonas vaginalis G3]EAY19702.1 histidinol-phosphate aminotransferase, putative [Trichomonas vaginalis G3]KAI5521278.1 aminotransferase-related family [Trichomonas vaginalis G3]|eukprot:XP_001580688.1 histidinol-phosphate aminotransferase [Trichomonas vaginalis G3]
MLNDPIVAKYQKPSVQCFHGGQSYMACKNFKCDFSVTTNLSGPPKSAVQAALDAFNEIEHYPDQDSWECRCHLADAMKMPPEQILLGNGASEFIDMVPRLFKAGQKWRPGPWPAQFMEYERAATNAGLVKVPNANNDAELTIMINPNSPTGDYIPFEDLRAMIARDSRSTFLIDESFMPCFGPDWMNHSAIRLIEEFGDRVIVCMSWTKVLACPLIRLGTLCSTKNIIDQINKHQIPWSVNGFAQKFMIAALHQETYFEEMWRITPYWKRIMFDLLSELGAKPNLNSPLWVPYVYVDFYTEELAGLADKVAFEAGYPLRWCKSFGTPTCCRLGVRTPQHALGLVTAFKSCKELHEGLKAQMKLHAKKL